MQMHTTSFWLTVPEIIAAEFAGGRAAAIEGLRGLGAALETVAALSLMCDPRDLGRSLGDGNEGPLFDPTLYIFDNVPGGVGLAERIHQNALELVHRARALITGCSCTEGCPFCVGAADLTPVAGAAPTPFRKRAALTLFELLFLAS
jgi:DEAD/DEAH box helicase domain-containing protein